MADNYSVFGKSFQEDLVQIIFHDRAFADQISEVLNIEFFELAYLREFMRLLLEYRNKYDRHPTAKIMEAVLGQKLENFGNELLAAQILDFFKRLSKGDIIKDVEYIKDASLDFAKKQDLKVAMIKSIDLLKESSFDEISQVINESLKRGLDTNIGYDYIKDFEQRYLATSRDAIATAWGPIDDITQGGLGRGELGVIIASSGAGKTLAMVHLGAEGMLKGMLEVSEERMLT